MTLAWTVVVTECLFTPCKKGGVGLAPHEKVVGGRGFRNRKWENCGSLDSAIGWGGIATTDAWQNARV